MIIVRVIVEMARAFLEIQEEEKIVSFQGGKKVTITVANRVLYGTVDYGVAGILGSVVFWMNAHAFSTKDVYLATAMYDFIAAAGFYWFCDKTGLDVTFGRSYRRVANVLSKYGIFGKILAGLLFLGVSVKAILWEGPEVICFLFQKELKSKLGIWVGLFILSLLQAIFGAWLYTTGYDLWQKSWLGALKAQSDIWTIVFGAGAFIVFLISVYLFQKVFTMIMQLIKKLIIKT